MDYSEKNAEFSPKDPEEVVTLNFDFSAFGTGWDSADVTCAQYSGVADPDAASMVLGSPIITDSIVSQEVQLGVDGTDYLIRCIATRGNNKYLISGILPVRTGEGRFSQSIVLD